MNRLDVQLAFRYLQSRRSSGRVSLITLIATGGVTVGVMALIVVMGVMDGLQNELREKILVASPHVRLLTFGQGIRLDDWETVRDRVQTHPEVQAAQPFVLTQGLISAGHDYVEGVYFLGIEPDTGTVSVTPLPRHFVAGDLGFAPTRDGAEGGIALGQRLAERLSAFPGDEVTMVSPAGSKFNAALGAFVPRWWSLEVTGLFETGMYEYDNNYVVTTRTLAQEFAGLGAAVTGLEIRIRDPWTALEVARSLEDTLGYPYRAVAWQRQNASLFSALKLEKLGMGLILLLIVVVAAFNIVSTLTMVVTDKTREIGILRAMGYPQHGVRRVFVLQGALIGAVGTAVGSVLGLMLARWESVLATLLFDRPHLIPLDPSVYFIDHLPLQAAPGDVVVITAASLAVATLATLYPAGRAAALNPVDAIRYE